MPLDAINTTFALTFVLAWCMIGEIVIRGRC